jgi:hypothetical protein
MGRVSATMQNAMTGPRSEPMACPNHLLRLPDPVAFRLVRHSLLYQPDSGL